YERKWKEEIHGEAVNVCTTNENMTSQTCLYCFSKLSHPNTRIMKNNKVETRSSKGAFLCRNPRCISVIKKCASKSRGALSALTIGLVGISTLLFGTRMPSFNNKISQLNTEEYIKQTS
ncbi:hypothetical protein EDC94DRAFT_673732, partial [Helicostylum pulchrum]